jgi:hypothetical protein
MKDFENYYTYKINTYRDFLIAYGAFNSSSLYTDLALLGSKASQAL